MKTGRVFKSKYFLPGVLLALLILLFLLTRNSTESYTPSPVTVKKNKWERVRGRLVQIDVSGNTAIGVSPNGATYYSSNMTAGDWVKIKGPRFKQVVKSLGLTAYGLKPDGSIYYTPDILSGSWKRVPGWASQITLSGTHLVAIGRKNAIYRKRPDGIVSIPTQPGKPNIPPHLTFAPQPGITLPPQVVGPTTPPPPPPSWPTQPGKPNIIPPFLTFAAE
jgi:hypothetical protein